MPTPSGIDVSSNDGVAHVVMAKPPVNAFDGPFLEALAASVRGLPEDTRALVLSSSVERIFAAGGDLPWMAGATVEEQLPYVELCQRTYSLFEEVRYPTIAAIEGAALGGGLEVTLACDIRIAGRGAVLGVPEATIGLIAGAGGITRLTRVVGRGVALDLTLTGRRLSAEEALALNVVTRLAEQGQAAAEALALARHLADGPTEAIEASKRLAVVADQGTTAEALDREREAWATVRRSAKTQEGLEAFVERRAPDFRAAAARQASGGPPAA